MRRLHEGEGGERAADEAALELPVAHRQQRSVRAGVGVVDLDVEAAEGLDDGRHGVRDRVDVRDVALDRRCLHPAGTQQVGGRLDLGRRPAENGDRRALGGQRQRDALAHALPAPVTMATLPSRMPMSPPSAEPLEDHGHALAAADAHGLQADCLSSAVQRR